MRWSLKRFEFARNERLDAIKQMVGKHYAEDGASQKQPINMLAMGATGYTQKLAAQSPAVAVSTPFLHAKPQAAELQVAINHLLKEIKFRRDLQRVVLDSLFTIGIMKVGLDLRGSVEIGGALHDEGQPYADVISFDNFVADAQANVYERCEYVGDKYKMPLEVALEHPLFDAEQRAKLKSSEKNRWNDSASASPENITQGEEPVTEYREHVSLWDIWLPKENLIITVAADCDDVILREEEWQGPESGPYKMLGYEPVPENLLPLAPVQVWRDIADLTNRLFSKLGRQALRQKTIGLAQSGKQEDVKRINEAQDGQVVKNDSPQAFHEFSTGGANQQGFGFMMQCKSLASWHMGNLDTMLGLAAGSDTATQDKLMSSQSNERIQFMQGQVYDFCESVVRDLGAYLWYDPLIELPLVKRAAGVEVPFTFAPELREGDYLDYNISIVPHSLQQKTPEQKMKTIIEAVQVLMPLAPYMQQEQLMFNVEAIVRAMAQYTGVEELLELIRAGNGMPLETHRQEMPDSAGRAPKTPTHSVYERVNSGSSTTQGKEAAMIAQLMGAKVQPKEQALTTRGMAQ